MGEIDGHAGGAEEIESPATAGERKMKDAPDPEGSKREGLNIGPVAKRRGVRA